MKKLFIILGIIIGVILLFIGSIIWSDKSLRTTAIISLADTVFPDPTYDFPKYTEAELDKMFEGVEPYSGELPPIPDEKLNNSTLLGIDSNNNGVRDDLEIWIVEHFGRDEMVVESFFAYVRSSALDKIIQRDGLFTDELYENDIVRRLDLAILCNDDILIASQYGYDSIEAYLLGTQFNKYINNTSIRKQNAKGFSRNMNGRIGKSIERNEIICKEFFEETEIYKIY